MNIYMFTMRFSDDDEKIIAAIQRLHGIGTKGDAIRYALREVLYSEASSKLDLKATPPRKGFVG